MTIKKLELEALQADLAAVNSLLTTSREEEDPIGYEQFLSRKTRLETEIAAIRERESHSASVTLFFAGRPVFGSKGMLAEFGGKAVAAFQDLVARRLAALEAGALGERGPIPLKTSADMMITDVVRGSYGFVLEEVGSGTTPLTDTAVKVIVDEVIELLADIASPDDRHFEEAIDALSERELIALRNFFTLLDTSGALVRAVEDNAELNLDAESIRRGKTRTEAVHIDEREVQDIVGRLYLLPGHRRFELNRADNNEMIYGVVSPEYSKAHLERAGQGPDRVVGRVWKTRMKVREIKRPGRASKIAYTLLGLIEEADQKS